ncbi:MAG: Na/Pi cotransporter family protein, partial [Bacteroidales bacterium]
DFLFLIGAIGLFLFGMKLMSESMQKIAGTKLRAILNYIASSKTKAVFSGLLITSLVQASGVVSVMTVSFVNEGMLSLVESIGVIMGANIGTTIKIWLISAVGMNTKIGIIALPIIGLAFPLLFSKNNTRKNWGEFAVGLSLLFVGFDFMKFIFEELYGNTVLIEFLSGFSGYGFGSVIIFVFAGMIITALIQSSSATVALTIVLCSNGWIPFELGAAMILGENIGTTVTANIAALIANVYAKRTALSHTLFNVIGVIWALILFKWFLQGIDVITDGIYGKSPLIHPDAMPLGLAVFHTMFNVVNTLLLVGFIPWLAKLTEWFIPSKGKTDEVFSLRYISSQFSSSELTILEAKKEIFSYAKRGRKLFSLIPEMLVEKNDAEYNLLFEKVKIQEDMMDQVEQEINGYINKLYQGELSEKSLKKAKSMQRIVKELENIGDSTFHMAKSISRKNDEKAWFTQDMRDNLEKMYDLLYKAFDILIENLEHDYDRVSIDKAQMLELQINKLRSDLMKEHFEKAGSAEYNNKSSVIYFDLVSSSEKMADHIYNINEAIAGLK